MAYYNYRNINHMIKNLKENYCPPDTYRNRMPSKEEFCIQDIDVEKIKKGNYKFEKKKEIIGITVGFLWFVFGGTICGFIASYLYQQIKTEALQIAIIPVFVILYFVGFWIIEKIINLFKYKNKNEYERIEKYYQAVNQFDWWQLRKKKDFWLSLNGREFEIEISNIFKTLGYETEICKQGGDEGVDIKIKKNDVVEIVQCKAHKSKISPSVARDLLGTMHSKNISHAYLVTIYGGTSGTIDFCNKNNITVWNLDDILKYCLKK